MARYVAHCVLTIMVLLSIRSSFAQDSPTITPEPSPSAFFLEPTATFAPDLETLQETVSARLSSTTFSPLTGEAFEMVLTVEIPSGLNLYEWVDFGQQWGDFEIIALGDVESESRADGGTIYRQTITAKLWTPGDKQIPDAFIGYGASENDILRVPVRREYFSVPTVVDFNDQNLKPMRPPVYLPYIPPLLVVIGIAVIGAGGYYGRRWWLNRPEGVEIIEEKSPDQAALDALKDLEAVEGRELLGATADILRGYISVRFEDISAGELTTFELIYTLRPFLPDSALEDLARVLNEADLVKFAGKDSNPDLNTRVVEFARRWVMNVERLTNEQQGSA